MTSREGATVATARARDDAVAGSRPLWCESAVRTASRHRRSASAGAGGANATTSHLIRPFASADNTSYRAAMTENRGSRWVGERLAQGGVGGVGGCVAPEIFPSTASSRSRALPSTARWSRDSTAWCALPNPRGPIRRPDSPRTSSGKIWQCLGSVWQCLAVLNPSHQGSLSKSEMPYFPPA